MAVEAVTHVPAYLFIFGYETPTQHDNNAAHGWDDEDSEATFIDAASEDDALAWGCEIAERYVGRLWAARGERGPSWKGSEFAYWIETDPTRIDDARRVSVPTVRIGEYPD